MAPRDFLSCPRTARPRLYRIGSAKFFSPSTRGYDLLKKRPFYARSGVAWFWYVDVEARTVTVSQLAQGAWVEIAVHGEDERARLRPFVDVEIDFALWWSGPAR